MGLYPGLLAALGVFALDQGSKLGVMYGLDLLTVRNMDVLPPFLVFRMGWNTGINFGLLDLGPEAGRWILIGLSVVISLALLWWLRSSTSLRQSLALGAIIGGALGNALDRVVYGAVADFLNMSCCGINNPFVFNVADIGIFLGVIVLVIWPERDAKGA
ncbi:MAG: signal peptidase II [Pseudomonadota bacterium]